MTTITAFVPLAEYLYSDYEPDAEYVDGVIEERPMGEYDHSSWQQALLLFFNAHAREWNVRVRPELRVQVAKSRFRVPDVTVFERDHPIEQILTRPPLAVFEVLSPEDTMMRMMRKLGDYAAMHIRQIWVVDTDTKSYYRFADGQLAPATHLGLPGERIHFEMSEIEAFLD